MPLLDQIQKDMVAAMKAKDEARLGAIRMVKSALQKHQVDAGKPLDEASELKVLNTIVKQRREAVDMFRTAGRTELADKEEAELRIVEGYLPAAPTAEEMEAAIAAALAETGITEKSKMGQVVNAARAKLQGKSIDGKLLSDRVREKLA